MPDKTVLITYPLDLTEPLQNALYDAVSRIQVDIVLAGQALARITGHGKLAASRRSALEQRIGALNREVKALYALRDQVKLHV
jgi:hypothetical protein